MITNLTTHVFTYSMSLEISTLYFDTLYQLPHLKNAASVTCPSRGGLLTYMQSNSCNPPLQFISIHLSAGLNGSFIYHPALISYEGA